MARPSLYRRILGDRFDALPAVLRRFHDAEGGGRARGTFRVERGPGRLRNAVASILGMPRAGTDVPVRLQVVAEGDRERWTRDFDGVRVETVQWARGESLMEAMGRIRFCRRTGAGRIEVALRVPPRLVRRHPDPALDLALGRELRGSR